MRRFVSAPPIPGAFTWKEGEFHVTGVLRSWRSTKTDRGDTYLKRHWFELSTEEGPTIEVYFDREERRSPRWLYTVEI